MGALSQASYDNDAFFMRWSNDYRLSASPIGEAALKGWWAGIDKCLFRFPPVFDGVLIAAWGNALLATTSFLQVYPAKNPKRKRRFFAERRSDGVCEKSYPADMALRRAESATTRVVGGYR